MRCTKCPLYAAYESEDECYEVCGMFGDGWDDRLQYEDEEGTTIGCYVERAYILKRARRIDEQTEMMARMVRRERET